MAAATLAGCGGHDTRTTTFAAPRLPHALASALAVRVHSIHCRDTGHAAALQQRVIAAINGHSVPAELQEELLSRTTAVVAQIRCKGQRPRAATQLERWLRANG